MNNPVFSTNNESYHLFKHNIPFSSTDNDFTVFVGKKCFFISNYKIPPSDYFKGSDLYEYIDDIEKQTGEYLKCYCCNARYFKYPIDRVIETLYDRNYIAYLTVLDAINSHTNYMEFNEPNKYTFGYICNHVIKLDQVYDMLTDEMQKNGYYKDINFGKISKIIDDKYKEMKENLKPKYSIITDSDNSMMWPNHILKNKEKYLSKNMEKNIDRLTLHPLAHEIDHKVKEEGRKKFKELKNGLAKLRKNYENDIEVNDDTLAIKNNSKNIKKITIKY